MLKRVVPYFPESLRQWLRKIYYPRRLRRFRPEDWPGAEGARRLVREGCHVVDAGANIGYVTMLFSKWVGAEGRVFSIEPVPEIFAILRHNVKKLGLKNVALFCCGVSSREGEGVMEVPTYTWGSENFYEARLVDRPDGARGRTLRVPLRTLDGLLESASVPVHFVKIDVEGHERAALEGAKQVLSRWEPALLVEVSGDPTHEGSKANRLFDWLERQDYAPYLFGEGRFRRCSRDERCVDYFFLKPHHIEALYERS